MINEIQRKGLEPIRKKLYQEFKNNLSLITDQVFLSFFYCTLFFFFSFDMIGYLTKYKVKKKEKKYLSSSFNFFYFLLILFYF